MQNKQHALLQQIENKEKHMYWKQTENIYSSSITTKQDKARNERITKICPKCHMLLYVDTCPVWVACKSH